MSNADLFANYIFRNFSYCLKDGEFPCVLKHADVASAHEKNQKTNKTNYRRASILPNLFEIFENLMYRQLYDYFDSILSPKQRGFCQGDSAQH